LRLIRASSDASTGPLGGRRMSARRLLAVRVLGVSRELTLSEIRTRPSCREAAAAILLCDLAARCLEASPFAHANQRSQRRMRDTESEVYAVGRVARTLRALLARVFGSGSLGSLKRRGLVVGRNVNLMIGATIDPSHCWLVRIGDDVTIARDALILAHDASTKRHLGYVRIGKVDIGDRVFIGARSIVMPGVRIGNDVVIGAGSVVTHDIPDGVVAYGVPARTMMTIAEWLEGRRREMERLPRFGREYTEGGGITATRRAEMNDAMKDRFGHVV
jgi:maltose O-acetyltransferase